MYCDSLGGISTSKLIMAMACTIPRIEYSKQSLPNLIFYSFFERLLISEFPLFQHAPGRNLNTVNQERMLNNDGESGVKLSIEIKTVSYILDFKINLVYCTLIKKVERC